MPYVPFNDSMQLDSIGGAGAAPPSSYVPFYDSKMKMDTPSDNSNILQNTILPSLARNDSPFSTMVQGAGAVAGKGMSALNNAVQSIPGVAPAENAIGNAAQSATQPVADYLNSTSGGQWLGDKLMGATDMASDFAAAHPEAAANMKAEAQLNAGAGTLEGINAVRNGLGALGENAADALTSGRVSDLPTGAIPAPIIKNSSQNAYKYSENVGGVLHPDTFTNDVMDMVDAARPSPLPSGKFTVEQKSLNSALDDFSNERGLPMTLEQYENFDKALGAKESALMDGFKSTNNSRIVGQLQDQIRARLQNLQPQDVIGGKEGFDALTQHAIPLWSTQAKMADLETLINKAQGTANPTQSTKTALNNLINSPKFNNYPDVAQDAIKKAAERGNADDLLGILGSRLNPITSNTLAGKAVNMATSSAFRSFRNAQQAAKVDKILSAMTDPVRDSVAKFSTVPELPSGYVKPTAPVPMADPYINPNAGKITNPQPDSEINLTGKPTAPVLSGTTSDYFAKGGAVQPTEAQKHAGNYKKDHINIHGLPISIETKKGEIRSGKDKNGKEWRVKMPVSYGYIKGTEGKDGEHVDCFIGPNPKSLRVYIIDQKNDKGTFDEHKCLIGFPTREAAIQAYRASYSDNKNRIMHVKKMLTSDFKEWLKNGNTKKPIKELKI